jgi:hypothetical protein
MAGAVNWLVEHRKVAGVQVILTDGYTPWPAPQRFPLITVIAGNGASDPGWGQVIRIDP